MYQWYKFMMKLNVEREKFIKKREIETLLGMNLERILVDLFFVGLDN